MMAPELYTPFPSSENAMDLNEAGPNQGIEALECKEEQKEKDQSLVRKSHSGAQKIQCSRHPEYDGTRALYSFSLE
jgi:hypothetical protein